MVIAIFFWGLLKAALFALTALATAVVKQPLGEIDEFAGVDFGIYYTGPNII